MSRELLSLPARDKSFFNFQRKVIAKHRSREFEMLLQELENEQMPPVHILILKCTELCFKHTTYPVYIVYSLINQLVGTGVQFLFLFTNI